MITFLRKIKQNLLSERKTEKYLKYAIGEIILVVIGILIALQVNNWNESRKNLKLKSSYTSSLINDFKKDSTALTSLLNQMKKDSVSFRNFQERIQMSNSNYDTLVHMYRYEFPFFFRADYSFNNTTLINLVGNNQISYPLDIRDSFAALIKMQKDFENINSFFGDKYFDILNNVNYYPPENYLFDSSKAIRDIIWDDVDKVQFLRYFERLADWKLAYTQLLLNAGRHILSSTCELKVELEKLESQ